MVQSLGFLGVRTDGVRRDGRPVPRRARADPFHDEPGAAWFRAADGTQIHVYGPSTRTTTSSVAGRSSGWSSTTSTRPGPAMVAAGNRVHRRAAARRRRRPGTTTAVRTATSTRSWAATGGPMTGRRAARSSTRPALLRSVGLLADGPAVWGRPIAARRAPGVFVIELPTPPATAPIELTRIGKWIERGARRCGSTARRRRRGPSPPGWRRSGSPRRRVLYIGSEPAVASPARVEAIERDGPRRAAAVRRRHWLKTLIGARAGPGLVGPDGRDRGVRGRALQRVRRRRSPRPTGRGCHDATVVLPFANLRSSGGERKAHGLTGYLVPEETGAGRRPPAASSNMPPGDADGAGGLAAPRAGGGTTRRTARAPATERAARPAPTVTHRTASGRECARRSCRARLPLGRGHRPAPRGARRAHGHEAARGDRPDQVGEGARRPQGERRLHLGPRGAVVPRGPDRRDRGPAPRRDGHRGAGPSADGRVDLGSRVSVEEVGQPRRGRPSTSSSARPRPIRPRAGSRTCRRSGGR